MTPVHESGPQIHSTPVHDQARPSDRGFDTYNGPDASVLTRGSEIEFYQGGAYGKLPRKTGIERHHMPADSVNGIDSRYRGPSIQMEAADHRKTSSFGNSSAAQKYRSEVERLIVDGQMRKAMAKEVKDVKSNFGTKYNEAIQQMLDYSKSSGIVPKKDSKNG